MISHRYPWDCKKNGSVSHPVVTECHVFEVRSRRSSLQVGGTLLASLKSASEGRWERHSRADQEILLCASDLTWRYHRM
jgi:hypothetical protein